jgi:hypothetical protein
MDQSVINQILSLAKSAHDLTEASYQRDPAVRDGPGWKEKQRMLLADMALHLVQTALRDGELSDGQLKRNLFSVLTISDQLLPGYDLKAVADTLYTN